MGHLVVIVHETDGVGDLDVVSLCERLVANTRAAGGCNRHCD